MFSNLGPLFKTTFRQAESNDTRQNIPHDERDKGQKKREEEEETNNPNALWEDTTGVSVSALQAFLINFLKTIPEAQDIHLNQTTDQDQILPARPPEPKRPTNTKNARAVRAYQSMAERGQGSATQHVKPKHKDRIEPTADLVASQELRDIYALIDDLDVLAAKGIQNLTIEPAVSFVESLRNAVKIEKSKI